MLTRGTCYDQINPITMQRIEVPIVKKTKHLGNYFGKDSDEDQISIAIKDIYSRF